MKLKDHFDKNNLHHAYLIEGNREEILPEIFGFFEEIKVATSGNPDFYHNVFDNFKIEDAFSLRSFGNEKSVLENNKKIIVLCINRFTIDAQNVLLKLFEEPILGTHFFIITPDTDSLFKTFVSRFYLIKDKNKSEESIKQAEKFLAMGLQDRLDFIKNDLLEKEEKVSKESEDENSEVNKIESNQTRALRFLNNLEFVLLEKQNIEKYSNPDFFEQIFKVREFLRQPGSSVKMLLESIAISVPKC
jgi:hypothetical protein